MSGNYHSKEVASVLFEHCNGMHTNRPQAQHLHLVMHFQVLHFQRPHI